MKYIIFVFIFLASSLTAHEMTPTYPVFSQSYVSGLSKTSIKIFNRRDDVNYYKIDVFDDEWKKIPFASDAQLIFIEYLENKTIDIYIRNKDKDTVRFICTESKLIKGEVKSTGVSSRICFRIKRD